MVGGIRPEDPGDFDANVWRSDLLWRLTQPSSPELRKMSKSSLMALHYYDHFDKPLYFGADSKSLEDGFLSQNYDSPFSVPGPDGSSLRFQTAEHFVAYSKAMLFGDSDRAHRIYHTLDPQEARQIGMGVSFFDKSIWDENKARIVEESVRYKFRANEDLAESLAQTLDRDLVKVGAGDHIWGIGIDKQEALLRPRDEWGQNLLGKILMNMRDEIRENPISKIEV
jgi:ribA/ribD-fused uncharacterized protein